jgi:hypothetical protein
MPVATSQCPQPQLRIVALAHQMSGVGNGRFAAAESRGWAAHATKASSSMHPARRLKVMVLVRWSESGVGN